MTIKPDGTAGAGQTPSDAVAGRELLMNLCQVGRAVPRPPPPARPGRRALPGQQGPWPLRKATRLAWLCLGLGCGVLGAAETSVRISANRPWPALPDPPAAILRAFSPPLEFADDLGGLRPVLRFEDGQPVRTPADWTRRRAELLAYWHRVMGPWPPLMARPTLEVLRSEPRENFTQKRVRLGLAPGQTCEGWLLVPAGEGPFGAVLVPFYEPETSIGLGKPGRDFAYQLARRGFVTLSIGSPGGDAWKPERGGAICQPLSFLAYLAANGANALASLPEVDPERLGVVGHSYGGKWALFAGALCDRFAAVAVSDPGIVWDEARPNVNYWEPWYLGLDPRRTRQPGVVTAENPRTGAYQQLVEAGRDLHELHALIAPRPLLVSGGSEDPPERWRALNHTVAVNRLLGFTNRVAMTNRATHDPTPESNEQLYRFFEWALGGRPMTPSSTR